ncbi:MAG: sulfotransferase [Acidimicrobiales bacterium]
MVQAAIGREQLCSRVPDFFVVGQAKSGTTALYEMLRTHPSIFMPAVKEPRYLASDAFVRQARFSPGIEADGYAALFGGAASDQGSDSALSHDLYAREAQRAVSGIETLTQYLALFEPAEPGQLLGEASPRYLPSRAAPKAIAALNPGARTVAIFREPASFLRSLHLQRVQSGQETSPDLSSALRLDLVASGRQHDPAFTYSDVNYWSRIQYTEQLRRYHAVLPREQTLNLIYDDFRDDNEATVRLVLAFLGVDPSVPMTSLKANPTIGVRSIGLREAAYRVRDGRGSPAATATNKVVKSIMPRLARRWLLRTAEDRVLYTRSPQIDEEVMAEIRRQARPEVERFSQQMGRDLLALWKYD